MNIVSNLSMFACGIGVGYYLNKTLKEKTTEYYIEIAIYTSMMITVIVLDIMASK